MRLAEDKIKTGIGHSEQYVRDVAVSYFSASASDDRTIMRAAIVRSFSFVWQA